MANTILKKAIRKKGCYVIRYFRYCIKAVMHDQTIFYRIIKDAQRRRKIKTTSISIFFQCLAFLTLVSFRLVARLNTKSTRLYYKPAQL
jgi:hypothetical protein